MLFFYFLLPTFVIFLYIKFSRRTKEKNYDKVTEKEEISTNIPIIQSQTIKEVKISNNTEIQETNTKHTEKQYGNEIVN